MPPSNPNQQPTPDQSQNSTPSGVVSPNNSQQPQYSQQSTPNYDFIINPEQKPKPKLFEGTKLPVKIAIVGGAIIVLLIVFSILRSIIAGPSVGDKFLSVAQDQQQIISIVTAANEQQGLTNVNTNSAITTQLGITTDQSDTLTYMAKNGKKVDGKVLSATLNSNVTAQLEASAAAGTYNETYKTVMSQELNAYMNNMAQLYKQIDGKNGKALLDSNYKSAKLLLQQLEST